MLRLFICLIVLMSHLPTIAQSLNYAIGYGIPQTKIFEFFENEEIYFSDAEETYAKSPEFSISIGFQDTDSYKDYIELRLSTFESQLINVSGNRAGQVGIDLSVRRYNIEIQSFLYRLKLGKYAHIDFGSKLSYSIRTDVSGMIINQITNTSLEINSINHEQENRFFASLLGRLSLGPFIINKRFSISPTYTFSYSSSRDLVTIATNTNLNSHIFELIFLSALSPRK